MSEQRLRDGIIDVIRESHDERTIERLNRLLDKVPAQEAPHCAECGRALGSPTVKDLQDELERMGAGNLQVVGRDDEDRALHACIVIRGEDTDGALKVLNDWLDADPEPPTGEEARSGDVR